MNKLKSAINYSLKHSSPALMAYGISYLFFLFLEFKTNIIFIHTKHELAFIIIGLYVFVFLFGIAIYYIRNKGEE